MHLNSRLYFRFKRCNYEESSFLNYTTEASAPVREDELLKVRRDRIKIAYRNHNQKLRQKSIHLLVAQTWHVKHTQRFSRLINLAFSVHSLGYESVITNGMDIE